MRAFALCLLAPALFAQASDLPASFRQELRRQAGPSCLVLEDKGTSLASALQALAAHDALADFDLSLTASDWLRWNKELEAWARRQLGGSGWLILDRTGKVLLQGKAWPKAEMLAAQLLQAGLLPPLQALTEFVQAHPDHAEARVERLQLLFRKATRRTRMLCAIPPRAKDPNATGATATAWTAEPVPSPEAPVPLDPKQDERLWGPVARELLRHLESPHWGEAIPDFSSYEHYPAAVHSPLMQASARRLLPAVQALLLAAPARSFALWSLWVDLKRIAGVPADRAFLAAMLPDAVVVDGRPALPEPNEMAIQAVVADARKSGDWEDAKRMLLGYWQVRVPKGSQPRKARGGDAEMLKVFQADSQAEWRGWFAPTLEALVRTRDEGRSLEVARYVRALPYLPDATTRLKKLALELGRPDLAARWSE